MKVSTLVLVVLGGVVFYLLYKNNLVPFIQGSSASTATRSGVGGTSPVANQGGPGYNWAQTVGQIAGIFGNASGSTPAAQTNVATT